MTTRPEGGGHGRRTSRSHSPRADRPAARDRHARPLRDRLLADFEPESFTLAELCRRCAALVASAGASLLITADGMTSIVESSDRSAARASDLQSTLGQGPTVDAVRLHRSVLSTDLADDQRWPQLAAEATRLGYGAALAVPLLFDATQLGVLTAYYTEPTALSGPTVAHAAHVGRVLTGVLLALPVGVAGGLADAISIAANHQARVHQAAGILSEREGSTIEEAFVRMRAHAYANDRLLVEVAEDVVTSGLRLP